MPGGFEVDRTLRKAISNDIEGVWMISDGDERRWTIDDRFEIQFQRDRGSS